MRKIIIANEEGSVLIVALILLVLLTLMGISATTLTNIELQIAGNEMISRANFYRAEAACMENVQVLANEGEAITDPDNYTWLHLPQELNEDDITDSDNWAGTSSEPAVNSVNDDQRYLSVFEGIIAGDSLDMTRSRIYTYRVVGKGERNQGRAIVEMGFRMPF